MDRILSLLAAAGSDALDEAAVAAVAGALDAAGAAVGPPDWLAPGIACELPVEAAGSVDPAGLARPALGARPVDVVAQPARTRRRHLLIADMDSTIVTGETLDELARLAGVADRVEPITRRAMNGEIDFAAALRERVALLRDQPAALIDRVLGTTRLSPGAAALVATMRAAGALTVLISGGFTAVAGPVAERAGFDRVEANRLVIRDGRLTGEVGEPIVGRERKLAALREHAAARGLALDRTLAVGDGANDLDMLLAAGLGVAYRAKPAVRARAPAVLDHADLTGLLYLQGYRAEQIVGAT